MEEEDDLVDVVERVHVRHKLSKGRRRRVALAAQCRLVRRQRKQTMANGITKTFDSGNEQSEQSEMLNVQKWLTARPLLHKKRELRFTKK